MNEKPNIEWSAVALATVIGAAIVAVFSLLASCEKHSADRGKWVDPNRTYKGILPPLGGP